MRSALFSFFALCLALPAFAETAPVAKAKMAYCQVTKDGQFFGLLPHPEVPTAKVTFEFPVSRKSDLPGSEGFLGDGSFEVPNSDLEVTALAYVRAPHSQSANYIRIQVIDKAKGLSFESGPAQTNLFGFSLGVPLDHMEQNTAWMQINPYPIKIGETIHPVMLAVCWIK